MAERNANQKKSRERSGGGCVLWPPPFLSLRTVVRKEVDGMKCHSLCVLLHTQRYISGELQWVAAIKYKKKGHDGRLSAPTEKTDGWMEWKNSRWWRAARDETGGEPRQRHPTNQPTGQSQWQHSLVVESLTRVADVIRNTQEMNSWATITIHQSSHGYFFPHFFPLHPRMLLLITSQDSSSHSDGRVSCRTGHTARLTKT